MTARARRVSGVWLGRRRYAPVLALQERLRHARALGLGEDVALFVEHEPVVTLGRRADAANVLLSEEALALRGIDCAHTGRGGDVTLHAPGQLVGYPIFDLKPDRCDVRRYVRDLGEVMRRLSDFHGVRGGEVPGKVGLWVDRARPAEWEGEERASDLAKLGAIGVALSQWVTMHGFALNLTTAVDLFALIVPCGIREHGVTSILELTGIALDVRTEAVRAHQLLADVFGAELGPFRDLAGSSLDDMWPVVEPSTVASSGD